MQIGVVGSYPVTIGWLIAILVLLLAVLGLLGILPLNSNVAFGMFAALAVARLT